MRTPAKATGRSEIRVAELLLLFAHGFAELCERGLDLIAKGFRAFLRAFEEGFSRRVQQLS